MNKKYRDLLERVRSFLCDYTHHISYVSDEELKEIFCNIQSVLYGILTQHPDNDFAEEDWENAVNAVEKLEQELEKQNSIQ